MHIKYTYHADINIERIDLNLIKVLVAIYEERQVTRAAARLGMTQPGVSHALARLRGHFSDELFVRHANRMDPTPVAERTYARILPGLRQLQAGLIDDAAFPARLPDTVTLGMNDYGMHVVLPHLIRHAAEVAPGLRVRTRYYAHGTQYDDLRDGTIDLSLTVDGSHPGWISAETLFSETARVVADNNHPGIRKRLTARIFVECPHVIMAPDGAQKSWVDDVLADHGLARTVMHTVPHFLAIPPVIKGTEMISTLPGRIAATLESSAGLRTYPFPFAAPDHGIAHIWPKRRDRDPAHRPLRDLVRSAARSAAG